MASGKWCGYDRIAEPLLGSRSSMFEMVCIFSRFPSKVNNLATGCSFFISLGFLVTEMSETLGQLSQVWRPSIGDTIVIVDGNHFCKVQWTVDDFYSHIAHRMIIELCCRWNKYNWCCSNILFQWFIRMDESSSLESLIPRWKTWGMQKLVWSLWVPKNLLLGIIAES